MSDSQQSQFDVDLHRANNVLVAVQDFVQEVRRRKAISDIKTIVDNSSKHFNGGYVEQAPEYFTEKYLIEPVLERLGLEPWPRPVDLVKDERNRPDYRIDGVVENCLVIAESKALNRERQHSKATEDMRTYLNDQTFLKTLRNREVRYSIGIATDGLEWRLIARDAEEDVLTEVGSAFIDSPVGTALTKAHSTVDPEEDWMPDARREVADSLVDMFGRENILHVAAEELGYV
ncbi:hypothetical protein [Haloglomus litoreum]|uniref:hypothetical protein n=1 Tax=Haloglomus litoreum TaxID=3034026 RepID=UPI0023E84072|nr:hypothetical protein [Haloglomus sp. DT116]